MGKVSKNAKTNRQAQVGSKDYVKVVKAFKSKKTDAYSFREKIIHKDNVKDFLQEKEG